VLVYCRCAAVDTSLSIVIPPALHFNDDDDDDDDDDDNNDDDISVLTS